MKITDLWSWRKPLGRGEFARWGIVLFIIKYNADRFIAWNFFDQAWWPWTYFGYRPQPAPDLPPDSVALGLLLLILSLPFIGAGVILTLRRLRDIGWPLGLVGLFFLPFVNLIFFSFLCLQPARAPAAHPTTPSSRWRRIFSSENRIKAAGLGILCSVPLGLALTMVGTLFVKNYGWGLFVGTPFLMGFFSAIFYGGSEPRTWGECALAALVSVLILSGLLIALAIEGVFCIAMAAPIGFLLALLGATVGWWVQLDHWSRRLDQSKLYAMTWVLAPLLLAVEPNPTTPLIAATTVCDISAPPETVWRHVISFGELAPPTERLFLAGIAYPMRARLDGQGVGAVRYCEFSTGPFVEPITVWDEPRHLAFDVQSQPHPMKEWTPYAQIEPAHLEGFFRSRRGEFRLIPLANGHTRLEGTTWYEQAIWPQAYWRPWSDYLIHTIHRRVLEHIKAEAELDRPETTG